MLPIADKVFEHKRYQVYQALTIEAEKLIRGVLASLTPRPDISSRTKSISSINDKITRENYEDFEKQMLDISGIRIMCMTKRQKDQAVEILKDHFEVIAHKVPDSDPYKMGYVNEKLILKLGSARALLPNLLPPPDIMSC